MYKHFSNQQVLAVVQQHTIDVFNSVFMVRYTKRATREQVKDGTHHQWRNQQNKAWVSSEPDHTTTGDTRPLVQQFQQHGETYIVCASKNWKWTPPPKELVEDQGGSQIDFAKVSSYHKVSQAPTRKPSQLPNTPFPNTGPHHIVFPFHQCIFFFFPSPFVIPYLHSVNVLWMCSRDKYSNR